MKTKICMNCGNCFFKKSNESIKYFGTKQFCSHKCYGDKGFCNEHKKKLSLSHTGKKQIRTEEGKISFSKKMSGKNHPGWKGGNKSLICLECGKDFQVGHERGDIAKFCSRLCSVNSNNKGLSTENEKERKGKKFKIWRGLVFKRDDWVCQKCLNKGKYLNAHHILNFSTTKELRFDINNGITFCKKCHLKFHSKYGFRNNTKLQIDKYLLNNI